MKVFDSDEHTSLLHMALITDVICGGKAVLAFPNILDLGESV